MFHTIARLIQEADSITISGHYAPDGDCFGSQVGLKEAILTQYPDKKVYLTGSGLPYFFDLLGKVDQVSTEIISNSLNIILDLNDINRIEDKRIIEYGKQFVLIDHHVKMCDYDFPYYSNEDACSTCEIIVDFMNANNWKISPKGASALYMGIVTDTGKFQFVQDFPKVFKTCSYLCECGANPVAVNDILALTPESHLSVTAYVLNHVQKYKDKILYLHLTYDETQKLNVPPSIGSGVINRFGNVIGYPIWVTLVDTKEGYCVIEIRSSDYDVVDVVMKYGGGGHKKACGVTLRENVQESTKAIMDELVKITEE